MSEWVFVLCHLLWLTVMSKITNCLYMSQFAITYSEYNYPTLSAQVCRLGLPFKQFSLIPYSYVSSCHSVLD